MTEQHSMMEMEGNMKIGEVCLLTNDVPRLASFYRQLLGVEESSSDETHQVILLGSASFYD